MVGGALTILLMAAVFFLVADTVAATATCPFRFVLSFHLVRSGVVATISRGRNDWTKRYNQPQHCVRLSVRWIRTVTTEATTVLLLLLIVSRVLNENSQEADTKNSDRPATERCVDDSRRKMEALQVTGATKTLLLEVITSHCLMWWCFTAQRRDSGCVMCMYMYKSLFVVWNFIDRIFFEVGVVLSFRRVIYTYAARTTVVVVAL